MANNNTSISVVAYGVADGGQFPSLTLIVDGSPVGAVLVSGSSQSYNFQVPLAADQAHRIQIGFYNTYGQRALELQSITVNGDLIPATSLTESYTSRVGTVTGSGDMQYGGLATFNVPA